MLLSCFQNVYFICFNPIFYPGFLTLFYPGVHTVPDQPAQGEEASREEVVLRPFGRVWPRLRPRTASQTFLPGLALGLAIDPGLERSPLGLLSSPKLDFSSRHAVTSNLVMCWSSTSTDVHPPAPVVVGGENATQQKNTGIFLED